MSETAGGGGRKRRANGRSTYDALIDAALAIWSEEGIARVTMDAVAVRAGRTRGTVYHHFTGREDLIAAVRSLLDDRLRSLFNLTREYKRDDYLLVAGIMVDSPELLRGYFARLLGKNTREDEIVTTAREHYAKLAEWEWLQPGIESDHGAMIGIGMWLAAMLTVDLHVDPDARREAARSFARSFRLVMEAGILRLPADHTEAPRVAAAGA